MMSGSECHRRLDPDQDPTLGRDFDATSAINEKASRMHRGEFTPHMGYPVCVRQLRDGELRSSMRRR